MATFVSIVNAEDIKPFKSDGCSVFPDGLVEHKNLWLSCCIEHDRAYWKGGTFQQRVDADNALKKCVTSVGQPAIANIMLAGVRMGGAPYLPTEFRWGYGWAYNRGYKALTDEEQKKIDRLQEN